MRTIKIVVVVVVVVERAPSKFNISEPFELELKFDKRASYELHVSLITCHRSLISIGQLTMCGTWAEVPWSVGCYSRGACFRAGGFPALSPPPSSRSLC